MFNKKLKVEELYNQQPKPSYNESLVKLAENYSLPQLEAMLKELFIREDIAKCADRWLGNCKYTCKGDETILKASIYTRLYQGGYFNNEFISTTK